MSKPGCAVCGATDGKLLRCSQCKQTCYCSKEHQRAHWKAGHKAECKSSTPGSSKVPAKCSKNSKGKRRGSKTKIPADDSDSPYTTEGSSENEILESETEKLQTSRAAEKKPVEKELVEEEEEERNKEAIRGFANISLEGPESPEKASILEEVSRSVVRDMDAYGVCVVDHFLGPEMGQQVLAEVVGMYQSGMFKDGQTVSATGSDVKNIRRDKIAWLNGTESHSKSISALITKVDTVVRQANKMLNNGKMGSYVINGRTKAMVACYPAQGSHYVKHVDNPNNDGRCITAIYYLNTNWNVEKDGGLLRIFPQGWEDQVANIEPLFDRIIFFWSDRRNPHEVQPSYRTRYAITLWYFDANEREQATRKHQLQRQLKMQNQQVISS